MEFLRAGKVQAPPSAPATGWILSDCTLCCICGVILTSLGPGVPGSLVAGRSEEQPEHPSQSGMQDVG